MKDLDLSFMYLFHVAAPQCKAANKLTYLAAKYDDDRTAHRAYCSCTTPSAEPVGSNWIPYVVRLLVSPVHFPGQLFRHAVGLNHERTSDGADSI